MAQVEFNENTGLFDSMVGDHVVTDADYQEIQEILRQSEESDDVEVSQDILDSMESSSLEDPEEASAVPEFYSLDNSVSLMSAVPSNSVFTPVAWQINLADSRSVGEHYLMYANRVYYSGSSSYWHYFLVLGPDISYDADVYSYTDCDVYSYYSYGGTVYYDRDIGSGTLDGSVTLVYSDLYFDYVGTDPINNSGFLLISIMLLIICVLIIIGGRRHV